VAGKEVEVKPAITAPVSRRIAAADIARSAAFYRDVLGFEIHQGADGTEATNGPALLHFDGRASGQAIVFFETDDVDAMHSAIHARGGQTSEIARVNWIKMRMFEVHDPGGNTLWYGQSFDKPHREQPDPMFQKALPRLPLTDLAAGIAHYRDVLGFRVNYQDSNIGVMDRDRVTVLLFPRTDRNQGAGEAYFYIENADQLCAELRAKGADVRGDPVSYPWGLREFRVRDLEGNELFFGQTFE
jgi:catechol 2,3-dioxygenase-like lactoylglutathione lyase family enzyme